MWAGMINCESTWPGLIIEVVLYSTDFLNIVIKLDGKFNFSKYFDRQIILIILNLYKSLVRPQLLDRH